MNILIVDDEIHVIDAIQLLIPWKEYGIHHILSATSVEEAKKIMEEEHPSLTFIDIIIGTDLGLDLMDYIGNHQIPTKVIAISGHDDFQFVRRMLIGGAVDYLLKPLSRAHLLAATEKALLEIRQEHDKKSHDQSMSQQLSYLAAERMRTLFSQLLSTSIHQAAYEELVSLDSFFAKAESCQLICCDLYFYPYGETQFFQRFTSFFDMIRRHLEVSHCGEAVIRQTSGTEAVILLYDRFQDTLHTIQKAAASFNLPGEYPICFGASRIYRHTSSILDAYEDAHAAFLSIPAAGVPKSFFITGVLSGPRIISDETLENRMLSAVINGDEMLLGLSVSAWLQAMLPSKDMTLSDVKNADLHFKAMFHRWMKFLQENYHDFYPTAPVLPCASSYISNHSSAGFMDSMLGSYTECCASLSCQLHKSLTSNHIPNQVADYMELNYTCKFNQTEYANLFHLNKEYLCRRFKETYGISMVTYLNQIRIRHAKKLLKTTDLKISTISESVGFEDDKYFAKLFKKIATVTPSEYRDGMGSDD